MKSNILALSVAAFLVSLHAYAMGHRDVTPLALLFRALLTELGLNK